MWACSDGYLPKLLGLEINHLYRRQDLAIDAVRAQLGQTNLVHGDTNQFSETAA